ncbi:MAG: trypsin-like peptidase domain-containing protein [Dehalococcoidia bacterium]|nr:trypsin-like peptidase domain-containing protein [Dehalococcoidia bacterium]
MKGRWTRPLGRFIVAVLVIGLLVMAGCAFLPPFPPRAPSLPAPPSPAPVPIESQPQSSPSGGLTQQSPIDPSWKAPSVSHSVLPVIPSFADVVKVAQEWVVSIQTEGIASDVFLLPIPQRGVGSGVIIDPRGYIVTNNHVVEGATQVKVTLSDGRSFDAVKINRDPATDLAVVQINGSNLPVAKIGRSDTLRVGDWVIAIGNALALEGGATVTAGIISHLKRTIQVQSGVTLYNLLQTDTAINPGNSGGALINIAGEVVGINTAIAGEAQNIGFAIAITPALPVIEQLITVGRVVRAFLGVTMVNLTPALASRYNLALKEGALVTSVTRGTPADRAGLQRGDVVISFDGQKITKADQVVELIRARKPGDTVDIVYVRGTSEFRTQAKLEESPVR